MINIIEITVGAATSFNHPHESYANFKPSVTIKATILPEQDAEAIARQLQIRADNLVRVEKERILRNCEIERLQELLQNSVESLAEEESTLKEKEAKLAAGELDESYLQYPRDRVAVLKTQIEHQKKALIDLGVPTS